MNYDAWRISYQSSEQAARAAFEAMVTAQEERDALAAHVDRLKSALDNILSEVGTHSHDDLSDDERQALSVLEATPEASFARCQAEEGAQ